MQSMKSTPSLFISSRYNAQRSSAPKLSTKIRLSPLPRQNIITSVDH